MQKVWKKIAALAVLFCLTLACAVLAACGSESSGSKTTYTVKVVLPDYDAVSGVELTFTDVETGKANSPIVTDANGIATAEYPESNYRVSVSENTLPEGWGLKAADKNMTTAGWGEGITTYVIELTESTKVYTVSVTLPNGDPAANVGVVFTATDEQPVKAITGADGKVSVTLPSDTNYLVTIDEDTLPANAAVKTSDANVIAATSG
ncbi:MAG: hypothetical protein K2H43_04120 [Clostridia bacterium]|nr:hypothetical protein [Clostridia bacterium]